MVDSLDTGKQSDPLATALDYKSRVDDFLEENGGFARDAVNAVAKQFGVPSRNVWLYLSILKLGAPIQDMVSTGELPIRYVPAFVKVFKDFGEEVGPKLASLLRERLPGDGSKTHREIIDEIIYEVSKSRDIVAEKHIEVPKPKKLNTTEQKVFALRRSLHRILAGITGMEPDIRMLLTAKPSLVRKAAMDPNFAFEFQYIANLLRFQVEAAMKRKSKKVKKD